MEFTQLLFFKYFAQACTESSFFGIGTWYKYVGRKTITSGSAQFCELDFSSRGLGTIWLVIAGLTDILLRVGAMVAVGFFIFGAFKMVTSQGSPEGVKSARETMTNSIIGLLICIFSAWLISFLIERILA